MKNTRIEVRANRQPWICDSIAIHITAISQIGNRESVALAQPLILSTLTEDDLHHEQRPTFSLRPNEAQQFMDELWRAGIRPTEGAGSVGQLAATERHLQDMRSLVFNKPRTDTAPAA